MSLRVNPAPRLHIGRRLHVSTRQNNTSQLPYAPGWVRDNATALQIPVWSSASAAYVNATLTGPQDLALLVAGPNYDTYAPLVTVRRTVGWTSWRAPKTSGGVYARGSVDGLAHVSYDLATFNQEIGSTASADLTDGTGSSTPASNAQALAALAAAVADVHAAGKPVVWAPDFAGINKNYFKLSAISSGTPAWLTNAPQVDWVVIQAQQLQSSRASFLASVPVAIAQLKALNPALKVCLQFSCVFPTFTVWQVLTCLDDLSPPYPDAISLFGSAGGPGGVDALPYVQQAVTALRSGPWL